MNAFICLGAGLGYAMGKEAASSRDWCFSSVSLPGALSPPPPAYPPPPPASPASLGTSGRAVQRPTQPLLSRSPPALRDPPRPTFVSFIGAGGGAAAGTGCAAHCPGGTSDAPVPLATGAALGLSGAAVSFADGELTLIP